MATGFDRVAPYYDRLKRLVFGNAVRESERDLLKEISGDSRVLIVGGGSGEMLPELVSQHPDRYVCYVEASARMLDLARRRVKVDSGVHFICGTHDDIPDGDLFDVIVTPFLLDLYPEGQLRKIVASLSGRMTPEGLWLAVDFVNTTRWQRMLLATMYRFFSTTAGVKAKELPPWKHVLMEAGLHLVREKFFWSGFICSSVWKAANH